jgi:hypothetical protein
MTPMPIRYDYRDLSLLCTGQPVSHNIIESFLQEAGVVEAVPRAVILDTGIEIVKEAVQEKEEENRQEPEQGHEQEATDKEEEEEERAEDVEAEQEGNEGNDNETKDVIFEKARGVDESAEATDVNRLQVPSLWMIDDCTTCCLMIG